MGSCGQAVLKDGWAIMLTASNANFGNQIDLLLASPHFSLFLLKMRLFCFSSRDMKLAPKHFSLLSKPADALITLSPPQQFASVLLSFCAKWLVGCACVPFSVLWRIIMMIA